jgi:Holliday junction resolvase
MAATPEKKVKARVEATLKARGVYYFFPATHGYGRSGVPDIVACARGQFLAIECKAGNNKPTALQERELERVKQSGGVGLVIREDNFDELEQLLEQLCRS